MFPIPTSMGEFRKSRAAALEMFTRATPGRSPSKQLLPLIDGLEVAKLLIQKIGRIEYMQSTCNDFGCQITFPKGVAACSFIGKTIPRDVWRYFSSDELKLSLKSEQLDRKARRRFQHQKNQEGSSK